MDIRKTRAYKYALECVNDTSGKTPKYVRLQAGEWLAIADGKRAYYLPSREIYRFCVEASDLPAGELAAQEHEVLDVDLVVAVKVAGGQEYLLLLSFCNERMSSQCL